VGGWAGGPKSHSEGSFKKKNPCPDQISNPGHPANSQLLIS
jgi:hypothetical protein